MKSKNTLHKWLWKWHFIAGIISLPVVILLSITGMVYLFKDTYEQPIYETLKKVAVQDEMISYQQQWEIANESAVKPPITMILPQSKSQATEFVSGRFSDESSLFINPYTGEVLSEIIVHDTDMSKVRKLHGELLLGKYGTKVIELVGSWMVVLILTGLYIWWPRKIKGFFSIRRKESKRAMYRDIHAIIGFWFSILLFMVLAGGLPWTDVFGNNFKWLQEVTHTGYPENWDSRTLSSEVQGAPLTLDEIVTQARDLKLTDKVNIGLPQSPHGVYSIFNTTSNLSTMRMIHLDQYSGEQLVSNSWSDIGPLMQGRLWMMAFHQGEFGLWNWYLMLFIAFMLLMMSCSAIYSYLLRKKKGSWSVPDVPNKFKIGGGVIFIIAALGIILPLFGMSVVIIAFYEIAKKRKAYSTSS